MDKTSIETTSLKSLRRNSLIVTKSTLRMSSGFYCRKRQNEANLLYRTESTTSVKKKKNLISRPFRTVDFFFSVNDYIITNLTHKLQLGRTPEIHLSLSNFCPRKKCLAYIHVGRGSICEAVASQK